MSIFRGPLTPPLEASEPEPDPEPHHQEVHEAFLRFIHLTARKRELNQELKNLRGELERLEPLLRDYLTSSGVTRQTIKGFTVFLRQGLWGRPKEGISSTAICQALKESGLGHFVHERYYAKQIASHLEGISEAYQSELAEGVYQSLSELLPAPLAAVLNLEPYYSVIALDKRGKEITS